ncbi:Hypothetical_protein [Hexamita inflata]|uniref:Hypothetical_protein n=1 Tax=Hexamita inflata TaxID=28002 RepID=A0AA86TWJ5_9EUKA|nr:Hypothetical protein HINF_LOCUS19485 [Hexamita inflata]
MSQQFESSSESTSSQDFGPFAQDFTEESLNQQVHKELSVTVPKLISRFMHNAPPNEFLMQQTDYNYIFSLNVDYINNQKYLTLSIDFQGDYQTDLEYSELNLNVIQYLNKVVQSVYIYCAKLI